MNILLGHLVGDFLLQNRWLAEKKLKWWGLIIHSALATGAFYAFNQWSPLKMLLAFCSHAFIDGMGIGENYPVWIRQGTPFSDAPPPLWLRILADQIIHLVCYYLISLIT